MVRPIDEQFKKIIDQYSDEVLKASDEALEEAGEYTRALVKKRSPRWKNRDEYRVGKPRYASGWKMEKEKISAHVSQIILHNVNDPTLTHLLERGHVIKKPYSYRFGDRARAYPHIRISEEDGAKYHENILRQKLEGL